MKARERCWVCKTAWPCRVVTEDRIPHGTTSGYNHACRCTDCVTAKRGARGLSAVRTGRADDGIVDWVVIDRLLARDLPWTAATPTERKVAAARAFARGWDDAYVFAQEYLNLRSQAIKAVREDLAAWLSVAA